MVSRVMNKTDNMMINITMACSRYCKSATRVKLTTC